MRGYPTVRLFPAGNLKSRTADYEGDVDANDMLLWLREHAATPFNVMSRDGKSFAQPHSDARAEL